MVVQILVYYCCCCQCCLFCCCCAFVVDVFTVVFVIVVIEINFCCCCCYNCCCCCSLSACGILISIFIPNSILVNVEDNIQLQRGKSASSVFTTTLIIANSFVKSNSNSKKISPINFDKFESNKFD